MRFYAGIGSRNTPPEVLIEMVELGTTLGLMGWTLRSGGAEGADEAFEEGALRVVETTGDGRSKVQIFLPWKNFNGHPSELYTPLDEAYEIAKRYHPNWKVLKPPARKLMARNSHQVLGPDLNDPVSFILCWTPEGKGGGGTGQAIRIAKDYSIPVYDLGKEKKGM